jgi:septum formation protein
MPDASPSHHLVVASASPRRQALLREAHYTFVIDPADIDEDDVPTGLLPAELAEHLAVEKARVVAARRPEDVVLAADTVVAHGTTPLGKPADADDARRMLKLLAGSTHHVITGVAVVRRASGFERRARVTSAVRMRELTDAEVERYVASRQWEGKAGGYGLQDAAGFPTDDPTKDPFVVTASGSATNIVGLPMDETRALLGQAGVTPLTAGR